MSEINETSPVPEMQAPRPNPLSRIGGLLSSPGDTMKDVALRPDVLVPLIIILLGLFLSFWLITPKVDDSESMRETLAEREMTEQQIEEVVARMDQFKGIAAFVNPIMVFLFAILLPAAVYWVVFLAFGSQAKFKQFFSVVLYSWMPILLRYLLLPLVLWKRSGLTSWEAQTALRSNLGFLTSPTESPVRFAILSSIDIFTFAGLALMVIGFAAASRFSRGQAAAIVIAGYLVTIGIGAGIAAAFA